MMNNNIHFCQIEKCKRKTCSRNQINIQDKTIPHSFYVERPPDCPYRKEPDNFYHVIKKIKE